MTNLLGVPVDAAYHLLSALTTALTPVLGGLAAVIGIVLVTVAVRLLLMPLSFRAMRGQAAAARLAPQLQALRAKYSRQPERLQREMTALYRREGTTMFAGISPLLLQWPVLSVIYLLFRSAHVAGGPNTLLIHKLLSVPLGTYWMGGAGVVSVQGAVFLGVFALLAGACWLSATAPGAQSASGNAPGTGLLGRVLPYLTVVFAAFAPLATGIYLVTSIGWSVAERRLFHRREARKSPGAGPSAAPDRAKRGTVIPPGRPG
ncbi:MAG TPA: membrane protein insertase YidC [Streptosporangiaceae bacterium]